MEEKRHLPSISSSKADLLPELITFTEGGQWMRRTRLEKCLILLIVFILLVIATLATLFILFFVFKLDSPTEDVCSTTDCLQAAAFLSESIDPTADPCEDFYQFACGKWVASHPIPADSSSIHNFKLIGDDVQEMLKELLMDTAITVPKGIQQARSYFRSCEDTDRIDKRGTKPLLQMFKAAGEMLYPTLNPNWIDEGWSLSEVVEKVGRVGGLNMVDILAWYVYPDEKNSTWSIITFTQPDTLLPTRDMYLQKRNSTILATYEAFYTKVNILLGANDVIARRDARDVVDFEIQIANATEPPEMRRDSERLYNKMTFKDMMQRYPDFDWITYLKRVFNGTVIEITEDEPLVNRGLTFYDQLFPLLRRTPRRTILNYCMWKITYSMLGLLNKEIRDIKNNFYLALKGIKRTPERWKTCVSSTDSWFKEAVGRLYVDRKFPPETKERMNHLISNLQSTFREMILEADWMTQATKQAAIDKLYRVNFKIGYPDDLMNDTALSSKTEEFNVTETMFFESNVDIKIKKSIQSLNKLRKPVDRKEWYLSAATVNAFYDPVKNDIVFPAGVLNKPFFSNQFLDAMNYGGIGMVIGHELTHGFDDEGREYDKMGNLGPWWHMEDVERFREKTKCMVQQYSNFTDPVFNINVNGRMTLGENIADNGGLKEAYRAYRKSIAERGHEEPKLPVLPYTPDQLFFIAFGQFWCGDLRDEYRRILLAADYHSPMMFRVLGPLQNSEDFSRAFNCPLGSRMNPKRKCHVW